MNTSHSNNSLRINFCGPPFACWENSVRTKRTRIDPIYGRTILFHLPLACYANDLLDAFHFTQAFKVDSAKTLFIARDEVDPGLLTWETITDAASYRWDQEISRFLREVPDTDKPMEVSALSDYKFPDAMIGWAPKDKPWKWVNSHASAICTDVRLTLHVLSHHEGNIFMATRPESKFWDVLFQDGFEVNENIVVPCEPSNQLIERLVAEIKEELK